MVRKRKRETTHRVRGRALRALSSTRRLEILEALMSEQPATVDDLGRYLGQDPKSLYHHLRPLVQAGLVIEVGTRATSKRPARLFRLPADRLQIDPKDRSKGAMQARHRVAKSIFRTAARQFERELGNPDVRLSGKRQTLAVGHRVARLTPQGLEQVNAKVQELFELLGKEHDPRGRPFALTLQLAPAIAAQPSRQ